MNLPELSESFLQTLEAIAARAGKAIMQIYDAGEVVVQTKDDQSPVTEADLAADRIIREALVLHWNIPIISEEQPVSWEERRHWETYFLVDPLDGTKGFIRRNAAFTVNIALIARGEPVAGVVRDPQRRRSWSGCRNVGARIDGAALLPQPSPDQPTAVASKVHRDERTNNFLIRHGITETLAVGSSVKFALLAEGRADVYPRFGPTSEWDTAAGHAVLEATGGRVLQMETGEPLVYGKEDVLNPPFIAYRAGFSLD